MKFCFWGDVGEALKGNTSGGGELQIALLVRSLARAGHEVVVIDPFSQESFVTEEGIKIVHVPAWNKGWPFLRTYLYRIPALYRLFVKQRADFYYVRMRSFFNLLSYQGAKKVKGKFLMALASDIDLLNFKKKYRLEYKNKFSLITYLTQWLPDDIVFKYLLRRADYVIRQHSGQQVSSGSIRGKIVDFSNIIDLGNLPSADGLSEDYYIYIGSLTMVKGADRLYELIRDIDESVKVMIVGQPNDSRAVTIFEQLKALKNADIKGRKNHAETLRYLSKARALINTSEFEGYPNVFLEAWALGIPVLSYKVNPGGVLTNNHNLGLCFKGQLAGMKEYINRKEKPAASKNDMRIYITRYHNYSTAADRFLKALANTAH